MKQFILLCFVLSYVVLSTQNTSHGATVRVTTNGMQYGASLGIKKLHKELANKAIPSQSGRSGDASWNAQNIFINYVRVGRYNVQPLAGTGLRLTVGDISVSARGRVSVKYQKGWIKVGDTTNIKVQGSGVGFTVDVRIDARSGKPTLSAIGCSAGISGLDLDFSGGLSWLYNIFSSLLEGKLKNVLKKVMCDEGQKLINRESNSFLSNFPVKQNIENWATIDYSFQKPAVTSSAIDLLLRGEFLDRHNPTPSSQSPDMFTVTSASNKMVYVWLSDFTINSAGKVFHEAGLLKNVISPKMTADLIPPSVRPFLNTKSFEQLIPELYKNYPDQPIEFDLETYQAPTCEISSGRAEVHIYVKATINVVQPDDTKTAIFYVNANVNAVASVGIKSINQQLFVYGNVANFSFSLAVGGSIIGKIHIPVENQSVQDLVKGLVIDQANPVLNNGFPIPRIKDLNFQKPVVALVKNALRIETDVSYDGHLYAH